MEHDTTERDTTEHDTTEHDTTEHDTTEHDTTEHHTILVKASETGLSPFFQPINALVIFATRGTLPFPF